MCKVFVQLISFDYEKSCQVYGGGLAAFLLIMLCNVGCKATIYFIY